MKFFSSILFIFWISNLLACADKFKNYPFECKSQDDYNNLKTEYRNLNLDPLEIKATLLPLVYGEINFNSDKYNIMHETLSASDIQKIQSYKKLFFEINGFNTATITLNKILEIHHQITNNKNSKIRSMFGITKPKIINDCNQNSFTKNQIDLIQNYDLQDDDLSPLLSIAEINSCENKNSFTANVSFIKGARVKSELDRWLNDYNDALTRFENNKKMELSPYNYIIKMNRWFQALHPFIDHNEEVAFYLSFYATNRLKLAPLFYDIKTLAFLDSNENYTKDTMQISSLKWKQYKTCLFEIIDTHVSEECIKF